VAELDTLQRWLALDHLDARTILKMATKPTT
jgi:hypothetical protein